MAKGGGGGGGVAKRDGDAIDAAKAALTWRTESSGPSYDSRRLMVNSAGPGAGDSRPPSFLPPLPPPAAPLPLTPTSAWALRTSASEADGDGVVGGDPDDAVSTLFVAGGAEAGDGEEGEGTAGDGERWTIPRRRMSSDRSSKRHSRTAEG